MTDKAKFYFFYFIKNGYNHTEFPEESIQMREGLIHLELLNIEHKLPHPLRGQRRLNLLSRELAEISIVVQGYAIHHFQLYPSKDMLVFNTVYEVRHKNNIRLTAADLEIESSIAFLRGLIKKLSVNKIKQELISLTIGDDRIPVPMTLRFQTVASLFLRLKRLSDGRKVAAFEQMESIRKQFFDVVEQTVSQYLQGLKRDPTDHRIFKAAPLITAIILLASGYLQTVDDYKPSNKRIKLTKYCSYREIMDMLNSWVKMKSAQEILSLDLPIN
jgi:hypothetical protein